MSYPLPTVAAQISASGITAPEFSDIQASIFATLQSIYGSDTQLTPDTQDGQLWSVVSLAIRDTNDLAIAIYNGFTPAYAQGVGLSAMVQINGIAREVATNSTAVVNIGGIAGTPIANGVVKDENSNLWNLPASVTIPVSGTIAVTATAQQAGSITATPGTINTPYTVVDGWQTVTNPSSAIPGAAIETDAALRVRQAQSTALPATTPLNSILAAVANSGGVGRYAIYENQGNSPDVNGVPGHSIAVVVEGGNVTTIAQVIEQTKAPGTGTYGTTSITVTDPAGLPITINFFELAEVPIFAAITIQPLTGYVSSTGIAAVAALANFLAGLVIGQDVIYNWLFGAAGLSGSPLEFTFAITSLTIGLSAGSLASANIPVAFNAGASCVPANISLTVL